MTRFPLATSTGYKYRPLRNGCTPGYDVWALQTALAGRRFEITVDGFFGPKTEAAVLAYQRDRFADKADHDGIAGAKTQRALVISLLPAAQKDFNLPTGLLKGHVEAESSFLVGNHTSVYENDAKLDIGLTMLHRPLSDQNLQDGFNAPVCLFNLAKFLRARKDRYFGQPGAQTHDRAWKLAVGAHNAPAWADTLARGGSLNSAQQDWFNNYVNRCIVYATRLNVG